MVISIRRTTATFISLSPHLVLILFSLSQTLANTDPADVQALGVLYTSLSSPSQLTGWKSSGGDPCGEQWKGITCEGSSIVSIDVSGLGLGGTMGYSLSNLLSLKTLDLSNNNIHDTIPYQLPPNLTNLNLASNNLSGNLPYSLSTMVSLNTLNASHNSLSQPLGDVFLGLGELSSMWAPYCLGILAVRCRHTLKVRREPVTTLLHRDVKES